MNNKYFIYTGNAYPHKNLGRLIDAVVMLKVRLKIVSGKSVFTERLFKEIKTKDAENYVELLGFQTDKNLEKLYRNSIAFVFPTLSEGFGLPPMEAINAGALVAASDILVLKEIYQDSIFYFDPYSTTSIANILEKVLNISNEEKSKRIKFAQNFVKRYSWAKMAKQTLDIYESCNRLR